MTHIGDVSRPDDHDWSADGADVLYSGIVTNDDGSVTLENGAVSLQELSRMSSAIVELQKVLDRNPVNTSELASLLSAIETLAGEVGNDAPVVKDALLAIAAFRGMDATSPTQIAACLEACADGLQISNAIRPSLPEVVMQVFVQKGSAHMDSEIQAIKGDLELSREAEAALAELESCLADDGCTPGEMLTAINRLKSASSALDGKTGFNDLKTSIDNVVADVENYIYSTNSSTLQYRIEAYKNGTLVAEADGSEGYTVSIHTSTTSTASGSYVSSGMNSNIQRLASTASQISDIGSQDYTEALSKTKRMLEISQSMISTLREVLLAVGGNMKG
ncbi:MAG: hypothetical protein L7U87_07310 [Chlamydiales bacterium]|nr:hypothetical protein [Chlamydiales bacterium]